MSQFTSLDLVGGGVLVEGTDHLGNFGSTVLKSPAWDTVLKQRKFVAAKDNFDESVDEFFAPLVAASDALKASLEDGRGWETVIIREAVEGVNAQAEEVITLDNDGVLLRILDEGDHDLLRWYGPNDLVAAQV